MKYNPDIIKSDRKTISIEVRPDGKVTLRVPKRMAYREIEKFVNEKSAWIEKTLAKCRTAENDETVPFTDEEMQEMTEKARAIIPGRVEYYSKLIGVTYNNVSIKTPKTRWGSCSSKGNLNFSALLSLFPQDVMDSVIIHELCHRKEMNHSARFYDEILKIMPDYREKELWLKKNGMKYLSRLKAGKTQSKT